MYYGPLNRTLEDGGEEISYEFSSLQSSLDIFLTNNA